MYLGAANFACENWYMDIQNVLFESNTAVVAGGAMYLSSMNSYCNIQNSTFRDNIAKIGGTILEELIYIIMLYAIIV